MKLKTFIYDRVKAHPEPTRKDTPKGEPVGLSREKFEAALYVGLTNYKAPKIAKIVGISSSGLLRKWKTEPQFKKAVREGIQDFIDTIFLQVGNNPLLNSSEQKKFSNNLKRKAGIKVSNKINKIIYISMGNMEVAKKEPSASDVQEMGQLRQILKFFQGDDSKNWPRYPDLHNRWVDGNLRLVNKTERTKQESITIQTSMDQMKQL